MQQTTPSLTAPAIILAIASIAVASVYMTGQFFITELEQASKKAVRQDAAIQECFDLASGTRTTTGVTAEENWELVQVDVNYEVVKRCLENKI